MIKENVYVGFETAKLLATAGFDVPVKTYFINNNEKTLCVSKQAENHNIHNASNEKTRSYSRPTLYTAAAWIREKFDYHVDFDWMYIKNPVETEGCPSYKWFFNVTSPTCPYENDIEFFDLPDEAYEAGIKYYLEKIHEKALSWRKEYKQK